MAIYDTVVFSPTEGFGGNGKYVEMDPEVEGVFRDWGRSGGGCVEGPLTVPQLPCQHRREERLVLSPP